MFNSDRNSALKKNSMHDTSILLQSLGIFWTLKSGHLVPTHCFSCFKGHKARTLCGSQRMLSLQSKLNAQNMHYNTISQRQRAVACSGGMAEVFRGVSDNERLAKLTFSRSQQQIQSPASDKVSVIDNHSVNDNHSNPAKNKPHTTLR